MSRPRGTAPHPDQTPRAPSGGYQLSEDQYDIAQTILGVGRQHGAPQAALIASMYAALGETDLGANPRTYQNNGVGYWGVLQGDMRSWPDPHDVAGQALAFFTGRGPQGQTDFHTGAINWVRQGVTYPPEIAVRTEVPSIWPADAYAAEWPGGEPQGIADATSIVSQVTGGAPPSTSGGAATPTPTQVPQLIISGDIEADLRQLDAAGLDINLWKELRDAADALNSSADDYLRHVQQTTYVTPHKAG